MEPTRKETDAERIDRNWNDLLQELRVTQTGIQILAGFLLTLPFQQRFTQLTAVQKGVFLVAVALATAATGLVVAPVSTHRLLFRRHEKEALIETSNRLAKAGLTALMLAIVTVVALIFYVVVGPTAALVAGLVTLIFYLINWVVVPLVVLGRRGTQRQDPPSDVGG